VAVFGFVVLFLGFLRLFMGLEVQDFEDYVVNVGFFVRLGGVQLVLNHRQIDTAVVETTKQSQKLIQNLEVMIYFKTQIAFIIDRCLYGSFKLK
jgi:hypothetical protein